MHDRVCFVDTETTGLDPDHHEIWEVGLIYRRPEWGERAGWDERVWQLPVDLSRADPIALNIGLFHDRRKRPAEDARAGQPAADFQTSVSRFVSEFASLTRDLHLAGAVVSFDADRLWRLLRANGECPMWHYHLIDVEALAVGYARGRARGIAAAGDVTRFPKAVQVSNEVEPPWNSNDLSRAVGVDPEQFDRHTAIGDARWAKAIYEAVMGDQARVNLQAEAVAVME